MEESKNQKYIDFIEHNLNLDDVEKAIIQGTLEGKTYPEIIPNSHLYGIRMEETTLRDKGSKLWKRLSKCFRHDINKDNFSRIIQQIYNDRQTLSPSIYVNREPIETMACGANIQPGSLIRIKAPQKMGKTLLLKHILADARRREFKTVICDFGVFEDDIYESYDRLLKQFCSHVVKKLGFDENQTNELSGNICNKVTSNDSAMYFFEDDIFPNLSKNLVLALDNFDKVLANNSVSDNFCRLLRGCYDAARRESGSNLWEKLHLIIIHSTDIYGEMDINFSPCAGVGQDFELKMFNNQQMQELFRQHELNLNDEDFNRVIELIDGHPYLLILAIKELKNPDVTLERFLEEAPTQSGVFSNHLRQLLEILNTNTALRDAYKKVINAEGEMELLSSSKALSFQLYSLGLIKQRGDFVCPSCNLYKSYFRSHLNSN